MTEAEKYRPLKSRQLTEAEILDVEKKLGTEFSPEVHAGEFYKIESGSKTLYIYISKHNNTWFAGEYLENEEFEKNENETTTAFIEAKRLMQEFANRHKENIVYDSSTENEKMIAWALTKGNDIFNWEKYNNEKVGDQDIKELAKRKKEEDPEDDKYGIELITTIQPQKS